MARAKTAVRGRAPLARDSQQWMLEKYFLMDPESPWWKQLFAYLTQSKTEAELDAVMAAMTLEGYMDKIACPTLLAVGEYDPRGPLDEVYSVFDQLKAPGEL